MHLNKSILLLVSLITLPAAAEVRVALSEAGKTRFASRWTDKLRKQPCTTGYVTSVSLVSLSENQLPGAKSTVLEVRKMAPAKDAGILLAKITFVGSNDPASGLSMSSLLYRHGSQNTAVEACVNGDVKINNFIGD